MIEKKTKINHHRYFFRWIKLCEDTELKVLSFVAGLDFTVKITQAFTFHIASGTLEKSILSNNRKLVHLNKVFYIHDYLYNYHTLLFFFSSTFFASMQIKESLFFPLL